MEVQPSSIAKYSLAGLPYSSKLYEFSSSLGEDFNDSEVYFSKLLHARKNYLLNWPTSSYFYARATSLAAPTSTYPPLKPSPISIKYNLKTSLTR
jgi:hypothetical protein